MEIMGVPIKAKEQFVNIVFWGGVAYIGWEVVKAFTPDVAEKIDITSPNNFINKPFDDAYKTVTGSNESLGADIYDGVQWIKKWFTSVPNANLEQYAKDNGMVLSKDPENTGWLF